MVPDDTGSRVIRKCLMPIGDLSKEARETRNEDYTFSRTPHEKNTKNRHEYWFDKSTTHYFGSSYFIFETYKKSKSEELPKKCLEMIRYTSKDYIHGSRHEQMGRFRKISDRKGTWWIIPRHATTIGRQNIECDCLWERLINFMQKCSISST